MEYLAGFVIFFVGWLVLRFLLSASYASGNPWSHSWIFDYWTEMGWISY